MTKELTERERGNFVTLEGRVIEPPIFLYGDLKLKLKVDKASFSLKPHRILNQYSIFCTGTPPIFFNDKIRAIGVMDSQQCDKNPSVYDHTPVEKEEFTYEGYIPFCLDEKLSWVPTKIEVLDSSGKIKMQIIQGRPAYNTTRQCFVNDDGDVAVTHRRYDDGE